jgi:diguanylate cyclase (GGDEF)-like protein
MLAARAVLAIAVIGAGLAPSLIADAANDAETEVAALAAEAVDLVTEEHELLANQRPDDQRRLVEVDERGNQVMVDLIMHGVDLTPAARATLQRLPVPVGADAPFVQPPPDVVYEAAISDLQRIAIAPGTATPDEHTNRGSLGLLAVAAAAVLALGLAALSNALRRKGDALEAMAWTDDLTGINNRRKLDHDIALQQTADDGRTAVMMVDIDHFKEINDQFGQQVGDDVLRRVSAVLAAEVRHGDVVYRYGGEEFCVLLPGTSSEEAATVAERVVTATRSIVLPDDQHVTVSVGVAEGSPTEVLETLETADRALYAARVQHA